MSDGVWYAWLTWDAICVGIGLLAWIFPRVVYPSILNTLIVSMVLIHIMVSAVFADAFDIEVIWISILSGTVTGLILVTALWTPVVCLLGDLWIVSLILGLVVPLPILISAAELSHADDPGVDTFQFLDQVFPWWPVVWLAMAVARFTGVVLCEWARKEN